MFGEYVAEVEREAKRALERYALPVVPGSELTVNHVDPDLAAHARRYRPPRSSASSGFTRPN